MAANHPNFEPFRRDKAAPETDGRETTHLGRSAKLRTVPKAVIARSRAIQLSRPMNRPSIEHLWSTLWAARFGPEDVRLRFELGGEEFDTTVQQVPRFLRAHGRASTLADALFRESCVGVVAWNGRTANAQGSSRVEAGFDGLQSTGFRAPQISEWKASLYPNDCDEAEDWQLRSYDLSNGKMVRDVLLWHAVAAEMPIYPSASVVTFLIDPDTCVMLHVYDDRGMDLIADDPAKLRGIHSVFAEWLLDYDRERMKAMF